MTTYFIGKDRYIHKITELDGKGDPSTSTRADVGEVSEQLYLDIYLPYLGFHVENREEAEKVAPFTVQFLVALYNTLYLGKDDEIDEEVLHMSLREVGRAQKEANKPK